MFNVFGEMAERVSGGPRSRERQYKDVLAGDQAVN